MRPPAPTPAGLVSFVLGRPRRGPVRGFPSGPVAGLLAAMLTLLVLLAGCAVGGGAGADAVRGGGSAGVGPAGSAARALDAAGRRPARFRASGVLTAWDRARARAFADGDSDALRALYVPGSAAGTSDLALLRAYRARGLRVEGMRMQLLAVEVLHEGRRELRLRVTDRLVGAVVAREGTRIALPRDRASTRVVELRRSADGRWRVAWVRQ